MPSPTKFPSIAKRIAACSAVLAALGAGGGCAALLGADFDRPARDDFGTDATFGDAPQGADGAACPADEHLCDGKCGSVRGACGSIVDCGGCPSAAPTCGAGGPNVCGVGTCVGHCDGKACGESDGCNAVCTTGACPTGLACAGATCKCAPACAGKPCASDDGCGGKCAMGSGCASVVPSNSADVGELRATGRVIVVPFGSTFDTHANCTAGAILGECASVAPAGKTPICVCRSDRLTIAGLSLSGESALALLVSDTVEIDGTIDVRSGVRAAPAWGGGGFATAGGVSGGYGAGGGAVVGTPELVPLVGGQNGTSGDSDSQAAATGGAGGGAIQITAGTSIVVNGSLNAAGGGGLGACAYQPTTRVVYPSGGAGGSGGGILLEAPQVTIAGALGANGGGGGAGAFYGCTPAGTPDEAWNGKSASLTDAGTGGTSPPGNPGCGGCCYSAGQGGNGATAATPATAGTSGMTDSCRDTFGSGGGGGGIGRIRINTAAGTPCACRGAISPPATQGVVLIR